MIYPTTKGLTKAQLIEQNHKLKEFIAAILAPPKTTHHAMILGNARAVKSADTPEGLNKKIAGYPVLRAWTHTTCNFCGQSTQRPER